MLTVVNTATHSCVCMLQACLGCAHPSGSLPVNLPACNPPTTPPSKIPGQRNFCTDHGHMKLQPDMQNAGATVFARGVTKARDVCRTGSTDRRRITIHTAVHSCTPREVPAAVAASLHPACSRARRRRREVQVVRQQQLRPAGCPSAPAIPAGSIPSRLSACR